MQVLVKIKDHPVLTGISLAILAHSLWAIANALLKWAGQDLSVYSVIFWSDLFALIAVFSLHKQLGGFKRTFATPSLKYHLLRALFYTLQFIALIYAITLMPMANAYSVFFCAPLITAIFSILFLKEKVFIFHWASILLGLAGIMIVLQPNLQISTTGLIFSLAAAIFLALGNTASRKISSKDPQLSFAFYNILVTLAISGAFCLPDFQIPNLQQWIVLAFAGTISGFAVMFVGRAFTLAPAAVISPFVYAQMVWVVLLGYLIFGDTLDLWTALGSLIIIASGLYLIYGENKRTA